MKMDKNKIVFLSVIGLVASFIAGYSVLVLYPDKENGIHLQQTAIPKLPNAKEGFSSKKEAVDAIKEAREKVTPSIYDERYLDASGNYDEDYLEKRKQQMVDSIYRLGRITYSQDTIPVKSIKKVRKRTKNKTKLTPSLDSLSLLKMGLEHQLFFSVNPNLLDTTTETSLQVEIDGEQTVKVNDRLQMRVFESKMIKGVEIKKNSLIYGIVSFKPNRVVLKVENIAGISIKLQAYDFADNLEGIYIKNSLKEEAYKKVLGNVINDINIPGVPQIGGIKNVFQLSNRKIKVTVNTNYKLILK
ncbi:MAG: hypothetical protein ACJA2S_001081 [Cyclobacteriaceae bacterium]|jgi:hypothetical protein